MLGYEGWESMAPRFAPSSTAPVVCSTDRAGTTGPALIAPIPANDQSAQGPPWPVGFVTGRSMFLYPTTFHPTLVWNRMEMRNETE
jgi:hypothetical protein